MSNDNNKYWALILGASSGFGGATALQLAKDGFNIIGVHLDRQATMHNVKKITDSIEEFGVKQKFYNMNAADVLKRTEVINELISLLNGKPLIKVIMHSLAFGSLKNFIYSNREKGMTKVQLEMTIAVMANSLVYWTQDIFTNNLLAEKARIFGMTSSGARTVIKTYGAVSAAKVTLESHIRQLADELGFMGVSANAIMAGVTDTPALRKIPGNENMMDIARRKNPRKRLTTPEDVSKVISLFCKDGGEWISGGVINVDGGEAVVSFTGQK